MLIEQDFSLSKQSVAILPSSCNPWNNILVLRIMLIYSGLKKGEKIGNVEQIKWLVLTII